MKGEGTDAQYFKQLFRSLAVALAPCFIVKVNVGTPDIDSSTHATPDGQPVEMQIIATTEAGTRAALEARHCHIDLILGVPFCSCRGLAQWVQPAAP